ncbi:MAG: recombination mediator RecR [Patescibacteria group bacterium]|jgi:recombination protein RecR
MNLPKPLQEIVDQFEALPGIGHKTASRLAFYLLNVPQDRLARFAGALTDLKLKTKRCSVCFNLTEETQCAVCSDPNRDQHTICVVEEVLDLIGIEQTKKFSGVYHVLFGRIDPLNNLGPDDILFPQLLERIKKEGKELKEVILATNPNMEGETTAMYMKNKLEELQKNMGTSFKITRLAYGLPIGASIEYADYGTLGRALENRNGF